MSSFKRELDAAKRKLVWTGVQLESANAFACACFSFIYVIYTASKMVAEG